MSDDVLQSHRIEPIIPEFVPDPDLDALFRQAVAVAKEFGWPLPVRAEFEARYKAEMRRQEGTKNEQEKPTPRIGHGKGLEGNDQGHRTRVGKKKRIERA